MKKALFITLSGTIALLVAALTLFFSLTKQKERCLITHIAQTGPQKEALPTDYLVEILDLPLNDPLSLTQLDLAKAQERLLSCPVIEKGTLCKKEGGILLIDYTLRTPIAFLADFQNLAIDKNGYSFPFDPFFTPKKIPSFYLGLNEELIAPIDKKLTDLMFALLTSLEQAFPLAYPFQEYIDISKAFLPNLGRCEIIITLKTNKGASHYLRLTPDNYLDQIARYELIDQRWEGNRTFDLRLDRLAFVQ